MEMEENQLRRRPCPAADGVERQKSLENPAKGSGNGSAAARPFGFAAKKQEEVNGT
jgi:hypothetical protein